MQVTTIPTSRDSYEVKWFIYKAFQMMPGKKKALPTEPLPLITATPLQPWLLLWSRPPSAPSTSQLHCRNNKQPGNGASFLTGHPPRTVMPPGGGEAAGWGCSHGRRCLWPSFLPPRHIPTPLYLPRPIKTYSPYPTHSFLEKCVKYILHVSLIHSEWFIKNIS